MKLIFFAAYVVPFSLMAFSTGPPIKRTGAPADGGTTCAACHKTFAPADSDARGSVKVVIAPYTPGVTQTIKVTVAHPDQKRWGFELISRLASDPTKQAGSFAVGTLVRVRCDTGHDAPCADGELQYAEHNLAQVTDVGAGFTYSVDWTPPATASGDILFYVAGNAANGDGTLNGDRIYTNSAVVSPANCALSVLPTLSAAVNAASFQGPIAAGSLVSLFGTGFQPAGLTRSLYPADVSTNALPAVMSCMAVQFNKVRAPMFYTQSNQVNVVVPSSTAAGPTEVRVVLNPAAATPVVSSPITVTTAASAPGVFTLDGKHVVAQFSGTANLVGDSTTLTGSKAAKPGDLVTFYATGLGDTKPHWDASAIATASSPTVNTVTVMLNGTAIPAANVTYAGSVPSMTSGLYQINIVIPAGVTAGDATVKLAVNGNSSPDGFTMRLAAQ